MPIALVLLFLLSAGFARSGELVDARSAQVTSCPWKTVTDLAVSAVGSTAGVAWIDFDGDGDLDLHFTKMNGSGGSADRLVRNDGGTFRHLAGSALSSTADNVAVAWADYDNDGDPDCYVSSRGPNLFFRNEGGGAFTDVTTPALARPSSGGVSWGDYDGDGDLDLYVGTGRGITNSLFRNEAGVLVDVTVPPLDLLDASETVHWVDHDNDGDQDLYVTVFNGQNRLFRNDGASFTDISAPPLNDGGTGEGSAWADYDNDGWLDLYLVNFSTANRLFHNRGDGTFEDVPAFPLNDNAINSSCAWGDYDNDGYPDLYFDRAFEANVLAHNDLVFGEVHFTDVAQGPLLHFPLGGGVAWGDYDADGDLDLIIATFHDDQPNVLARNDCAQTTNWLQVDLRGVLSNRDGVGARLRLVQDGIVQHRTVETSSGFWSQNSRTQQFGFGQTSKTPGEVDSLVVTWPSGLVQTVLGIAVNQRITVVEDSTTTGLVASGFRGTGRVGRVDLEWWASHEHRQDEFFVERARSLTGGWRRLHETALTGGNPHRFSDRHVEPATLYFYRLEARSAGGSVLLDAIPVRTPIWSDGPLRLEAARPNPFRAQTGLVFWLPETALTRLSVHDVSGRRLATLISGTLPAGRRELVWNGRDADGRRLPAGTYFYRLEAGGSAETRRLVLLGN